jgi:hypothetical protein
LRRVNTSIQQKNRYIKQNMLQHLATFATNRCKCRSK